MTMFLLRYGELATKSHRIRKNFEYILIDNIERTFLREGQEIYIQRKRGRIFAYVDPCAGGIFSRIFGLVSYSPVTEISSSKEDILGICGDVWDGKRGTFAVRARRTGKHPYSSQELARDVGGVVLESNPELTVDLDQPEHVLQVEVRDSKAYIFFDIYPGPCGLPLGSQGKLAAYVESSNDFLAAWLMMKRGARLYVYHPDDDTWASKLDAWDPNLRRESVLSRDDMLRSIHIPREVKGLVLGETLDDLTNVQYSSPIFRPLIGFDGHRMTDLMNNICDLETQTVVLR